MLSITLTYIAFGLVIGILIGLLLPNWEQLEDFLTREPFVCSHCQDVSHSKKDEGKPCYNCTIGVYKALREGSKDE